jgi:hypothetical protein
VPLKWQDWYLIVPILRNDRDREKERKRQVELQEVLQEEVQPKIANEIEKAADSAADEYEKTGGIGTGFVGVRHTLAFDRILTRHYRNVVTAFSSMTFSTLTKHFRKFEVKESRDTFQILAEGWILEHALEQANIIAQTTQEDIVAVLLSGQQEGLGAREIARMIRDKVGGQIGKIRAETIAITETHNAATFANLTSAELLDEELDLGLQKEWMSVEDGRSRASHRIADRQHRDLNEPFLVGGENLMRPGDPRGSAKNIIRCRCVMGYVTKEDQ